MGESARTRKGVIKSSKEEMNGHRRKLHKESPGDMRTVLLKSPYEYLSVFACKEIARGWGKNQLKKTVEIITGV